MDDLTPIDLAALRPSRSREEAMAAAIAARALPSLERRAAARGPLLVLADWARPALAAAAAVAAVSIAALAASTGDSSSAAPTTLLAEALEIPSPAQEWVLEDRAPTEADLILALEGGLP